MKINCLPMIPITALHAGERTTGLLMELNLPDRYTHRSAKDLAGDLFWRFFLNEPLNVTPLSPKRKMNDLLIRWAESATTWDTSRASTVANLVTSATAATALYKELISEETMKKILDQQKELEEMRKQLQGMGGQGDPSDGDSSDEAGEPGKPGKQSKSKSPKGGKDKKGGQGKDKNGKGGQKGKQAGSGAGKPTAAPDEPQDEAEKQKQAEAQAEADRKDPVGALRRKIAAAQQKLDEAIEKLAQSSLMPTVVNAAAVKAGDEAAELAAEMSGWGFGPGSPELVDPQAALEFMRQHQGEIAEIAKLAGQFRQISTEARRDRVVQGVVPVNVKHTKDFGKIFPPELVWLRPDAPKIMRAMQIAKWASHGLLGWDTRSFAKERGPFILADDTSYSMGWKVTGWTSPVTRNLVAKALSLGVAQTAHEEGRPFELFTFSTAFCPSCKTHLKIEAVNAGEMTCPSCKQTVIVMAHCRGEESFAQYYKWASHFNGGGTDFNLALTVLMKRLTAMAQRAKGADALFVSDGEALVSNKTALEWQEFAKRTGARLLYVEVGTQGMNTRDDGTEYKQWSMKELANTHYVVRELDIDTAEELAAEIALQIR